jgi:predicted metalloprotease with PDZ domain
MVLLLDRHITRSDLYDTPMSIIAHEFFHNWNGDAIRPSSDEMLWFIEGATVYYSYRVLLDINLITPSQYEWRRTEIARRYRDNPYRSDVPIARAVNSDLTDRSMVHLLYDGGFLAAEAMDRRIAELTGGNAHLIDVLRTLYSDTDGVRELDEETLCAAIHRVSGHDLSSFVHELVHEVSPPALDPGVSHGEDRAGGESSICPRPCSSCL